MGDIWSADKLFLFLAFFLPGFISYQIYGLFVAVDDRDPIKQLPAIVGYSAIHYAFFAWVLLVIPQGVARAIAAYLIVLVLPIFWPPVILLMRDWQRWSMIFFRPYTLRGSRGPKIQILNGSSIIKAMLKPEAMPWDRTLTPEGRYVRIRLKSGRYVGGYFGNESSVSTYPCDRQIYISHAYSFDSDGRFETPIERTGVLIEGSEIETLETIALEVEANGQK
jgi:hypothetical protein